MEEVTNPKSFPPYPQMILEAIDSQNKEEGSNESTISSYMESTYGDLPADHSAQLSDHLAKMKDNGELLLSENNYRRPDLTVPVNPIAPVQKRGRGRPRKNPSGQPVPKKAKAETETEPGSESGPTGSKTGRPSGRPKKVTRGRPKKVQPEPDQVSENGGET